MLKTEKNKVYTEKFNKLFPGGHTNYRISMEATEHRVFVVRAEGSHMWDVDGNEYIDYQGGLGPNILGHRHPEYIQALKDLMDTMTVCCGSGLFHSTDDIEVAEKLVKHIPCAEQVKFCLSGSEAVQMALRLARAYTGRPHFIRFGGHYHGWFDNVLGGTVDTQPAGKPFPLYDPDADILMDPCFTRGRAPGTAQEGFLLPWNDLDVLEDTLKKYGDEVAMIHLEAIVVNHGAMYPRPGYLEKIRELCTKYGIVMSIDEVITGFRTGLGGAQALLGVTPDIATIGKALGGGLPFSAIVGKSEIMEQLRDKSVLGPGTFNGYPLGMRAALTTIKILERDNGAVYDRMEKLRTRLTEGLSALAKTHGIPLRIQGAPGLFFTAFGIESDRVMYTEEDINEMDVGKVLQFWAELKQEGISSMIGGRWYMSIAHTDADVTRTLEAADKAMAKM